MKLGEWRILRIVSITFLMLTLLTLTVGSAMAQGGSECDQSNYCTLIEDESDTGSYIANGTITKFVIKSGGGNSGDGDKYFIFTPVGTEHPQIFDNGCYRVTFSVTHDLGKPVEHPLNTVYWERYGDPSPECQAISHLQVWQATPLAISLASFSAIPAGIPLVAILALIALFLLLIGVFLIPKRQK